jgi:hypothetical protein
VLRRRYLSSVAVQAFTHPALIGAAHNLDRRLGDRQHGAQEQFAQSIRASSDHTLPDRLRDRRGAGHGRRDGVRLGQHVVDRSLDRARLLLRLRPDARARGSRERAPAIAAGLGDALFWTSLGVSLVIAFAAAFPVNRWLISRGRGHALVHQSHAD